MNWQILSERKTGDIIGILLKNRGIKTDKAKKEFFNPTHPLKLSLKELSLSKSQIDKAVKRIKTAITNKEKIIVFGDYDADGVSATAIVWEALYSLGAECLPYIPERFSEGYGVKAESIEKLKAQYPNLKLIITVDNGIVAFDAIKAAKKLGIDVIITDHHEKGEKYPPAHAVIHTTKIGGAAIAWVLAREIGITDGLDLAGMGTIADVLPLLGPNRSFAKHGLEELNKTERPGLLALFNEAAITKGGIGTYHVGFIIAPRINAMGRLEHAIDSLRLLCTKDRARAEALAYKLGKTNKQRQKVVEEVVLHAKEVADKQEWKGVILLAHEDYHEGVIGLAAARLVEKFYRPAIVLSKGNELSKASARSISGFNIYEAIFSLNDMLEGGGGHPMAAGFTIQTERIKDFAQRLDEIAEPLLTDEVLSKKLKIDLEINFDRLSFDLAEKITAFEPTGLGNPVPTFVTREVDVADARIVGRDSRHLKLKLVKNGREFDAIAFGFGKLYPKLSADKPIDIAYGFEEDNWNGVKKLQLKIRDIKFHGKRI